MNTHEQIKKIIAGAVDALVDVAIEPPQDKRHGDYSTNVALVLSKKLQKNPLELANEITAKIKSNKLFEKVEVAGPGFINFYLAHNVVVQNLKNINQRYGTGKALKGKKIVVEYTDPNLFKEFHIGHLMSNAIGESISRVLEFQGAKVKRFCYQSDVGIGIAKAVFGKLKNPHLQWQQSYVEGNRAFEESQEAKQEIIQLNKKIFERSDKKVNALYDEGKAWSLRYFDGIYRQLGTMFNEIILESQVAEFGKKIVEGNVGKVFEKGEGGAIILKGENHGLHTRVFINSEGLPTYEAKELGLAQVKYKKFKYDQSVIVTGNEVNSYFKVLLFAMKEIFPELAKKTIHIGHGMMRLPQGKMSSRTGNVVTFESLLKEATDLIGDKMADKDFAQKEHIIEQVAVGALKYSILKQSIGGDITYDFEKSISFEGDSGPYVQYSYVRAYSVLEKAKQERIKPSFKKVPHELGYFEKMMVYFPEVAQKAAQEYQPHLIVTYLTELAREFNNYYAHNKIVDRSDELSPYRVALTQAFLTIIKNGLWLLGIQAPYHM